MFGEYRYNLRHYDVTVRENGVSDSDVLPGSEFRVRSCLYKKC